MELSEQFYSLAALHSPVPTKYDGGFQNHLGFLDKGQSLASAAHRIQYLSAYSLVTIMTELFRALAIIAEPKSASIYAFSP